jgi:Tol biopolymer transport system component
MGALRVRRSVLTTGVVVACFVAIFGGRLARANAGTAAANGKIVFTTTRDGNFEIYVMNADGTGQGRLTDNAADDYNPAWSPDGTKIAFASNRDGNFEIYVMHADGSGQTRITNNPGSDVEPAWSPDGSKIAFASDRTGNSAIYVMNPDGTAQTRLAGDGAYDFSPAWSPDGSRIAFMSGPDIFVMNRDGSATVRLTTTGLSSGNQLPAWSPDGRKVAFTSNREGHFEIYVMNADGSDQTRLTTATTIDYDPGWSPDGSKIIFESAYHGNGEIVVMNADGTGRTQLTNDGEGDDLEPDWHTGTVTVPPTPKSSCPSYYILDSRGSGESGGAISPPGFHFFEVFKQLKYPKTVKVIANTYPARGNFSLVGALLHTGGSYHASVVQGRDWLSSELATISKICPKTKMILTGYSQGAQVTGDVYQNGSTSHVLAVVLFGDPYFNSRDSRVDRGSFRVGPKGGLGSRPKFNGGHVLSYCHANDPVCQFGSNPTARFANHGTYDKLNEPSQAAQVVANWG